MKKFGILVVGVALLLSAVPAFAISSHPKFGSFVNAGDVPPGSTLLINITYGVYNDEALGQHGYWNLEAYTKHLQVWQIPDVTVDQAAHDYYVVSRDTGTWQAPAGAKSPGAGITQTSDISGNFEGGYIGTFSGKCNSISGTPFPFVLNFNGSLNDVKLGIGNLYPFPWWLAYCSIIPGTTVNTQWGWVYHYGNQTWNDYYYGTSGDIVAQ